MKPQQRSLILGIFVFVLGGLILRVLLTPGPSDQELIRTALQESIKASREGRPGNVLELLSREFTVNEQVVANSREVARIVRDYKPEVEIQNYEAEIQGDRAFLITPVNLQARGPIPLGFTLSKVEMEFVKEPKPRFLILPGHTWKLEKVTIAPESFQNLAQGFGGG